MSSLSARWGLRPHGRHLTAAKGGHSVNAAGAAARVAPQAAIHRAMASCNLTNLKHWAFPTITDRTPLFIRPAFEALSPGCHRWISFTSLGLPDNGGEYNRPGSIPYSDLAGSVRGRAGASPPTPTGVTTRAGFEGDGSERKQNRGFNRPLRRGKPSRRTRVIGLLRAAWPGGKAWAGTRSGYESAAIPGPQASTKLYPALVQIQDGQHLCQGLKGRPGPMTDFPGSAGTRDAVACQPGLKFSFTDTSVVSGPAVF